MITCAEDGNFVSYTLQQALCVKRADLFERLCGRRPISSDPTRFSSSTWSILLAVGAAVSVSPAAHAQTGPTIEAGVTTDERVRGLSWSDGRTAAHVFGSLPVTTNIAVGAEATTLRGSARHGGAEIGVDLNASYGGRIGLANYYAMAIGHVFPGGDGEQDYAEAQAGIGGALGPASVTLLASYAPPQDAIGGSNFYRRLEGRFGFWGSPLALNAHVGRSSGSVDDPARAERLRPGGAYNDWAIGGEYNLAPLSFTLRYSDTDIRSEDIRVPAASADYGARITAGANIRF
ncbi:TorF family putative porin [Croceicoccus sp. YJ47]|uniref:TorF family putative porin n=1 Tax=Croceicoccus sp. YJ47 TaxID=2798724 RepID=UPI00352FFD2A